MTPAVVAWISHHFWIHCAFQATPPWDIGRVGGAPQAAMSLEGQPLKHLSAIPFLHVPTTHCRCLLSCLTTGGRLWLLTPPGSHGMQWSVCADISARVDHGMTGVSVHGTSHTIASTGGCVCPVQGSPCTTFHWLPQVIPAKQGVGGAAVVAMGTRSGHVCVLAMSVPVCPGGRYSHN